MSLCSYSVEPILIELMSDDSNKEAATELSPLFAIWARILDLLVICIYCGFFLGFDRVSLKDKGNPISREFILYFGCFIGVKFSASLLVLLKELSKIDLFSL